MSKAFDKFQLIGVERFRRERPLDMKILLWLSRQISCQTNWSISQGLVSMFKMDAPQSNLLVMRMTILQNDQFIKAGILKEVNNPEGNQLNIWVIDPQLARWLKMTPLR